ncbi:SDR family NAD(P)-dependent oxidoreductase [Haloarcula pelagica]|uniref:SDR family NAD(P)-dependent oxidoreductase n=1 Tax=Haloarcula pelagica TaxID=3033389 RepID=UPI0024C27E45|nr:SDR family NAD(P)-dependent oxidoreductase [Halomicroarcula sp. YJ-61-S]
MMSSPDISLFETLAGQTALVTGSSRGIGAEITRQLAELGATVYASARTPSEIDVEADSTLELDVTDASEVETAVGTIEREAGELDILVNNAGIHGPAGPLETIGPEPIAETFGVNLAGPIRLVRNSLPLLTRAATPRVVNVASGSGQFAGEMEASHLPYSVSKAGLNAFTRTLSAQYPGLLVNSVDPGWVRTDNGGPDAPRSVSDGAATAIWLARFERGPSGRFWRDEQQIEW